MEIIIQDYGNGYRPTAEGTINLREFSFRMMGANWLFVVGKLGTKNIWWYSADDEIEFEKSGKCRSTVWHDESLPEFLEGLEAYLNFLNIEVQEKREILESAEVQAKAFFDGYL